MVTFSTKRRKGLSALLTVSVVALAVLALVGCGGGPSMSGSVTPAGAMETQAPPNQTPEGAKDASATGTDIGQAEAKPAAAPGSEALVAPTLVSPQQTGERIIDETSAKRGGTPSYWHTASGYGNGGSMLWTYPNGNTVDDYVAWRSGLGAGKYEVYVFIPRNYATTRSAKYLVEYYVGSQWYTIREVVVNQYNYSDAWVSLGTYDFPNEPSVFLGDNTGESYSTKRMVGFDAAKFVGRAPAPAPAPARKFGSPLASYTIGGYTFGRWVANWGYHAGEDLVGSAGTPVYAAADGRVTHAETHTAYGMCVVIEHKASNVCSVYGHLRVRDRKVSVGQTVSRGTLLGYLGTTAENGGWSPHLHFGIRKGLDPGTWVFPGYESSTALMNARWYSPGDYIRSN